MSVRNPIPLDKPTRSFFVRKVPGPGKRFELCQAVLKPGEAVAEVTPVSKAQSLGDCQIQGLCFLRNSHRDDEMED